MAKNLVIVESPAKAKTIEKFLGKDFMVKSSFGHVRDLSKTKFNNMGIDIENGFNPIYEISVDKKNIIKELSGLAKKAEIVWLASDEDREGEAISWHLVKALELDENKTKRIVFHEITKQAILDAIKNPRKIDTNLVNAQQARRVLDRLVGFELSPILWKKIKPALSAGRVQSVAVRLIVEREREINDFQITSFYKVVANFIVTSKDGQNNSFKAEISEKFKKKDEAVALLKKLIEAEYSVKNIEQKPYKKTPPPPFITSTLQQEASRKLGFSVAQTMLIAQHLYESGKVTYMRTDSVNLSETAIHAAKTEIEKIFGKEYSQTRHYKTKSKGAQEAHEAIRPTYMENRPIDRNDAKENRLYDLIWKRTIASQMADADIEKTIVSINSDKSTDELIATVDVIKFDGFLKVYMESSDDESDEEKEVLLPALLIGQKLNLDEINAIQKFTQPLPRYTEASLVKKLEGLGIGRPSTYAPTISTIQKRGYVVKEDRQGKERKYDVITLKENKISEQQKTEITGAEKAKLFPMDIGMVVNDFLVQNFETVLDYNFTAKVEEEFDEIAEGQKEWNQMIKDFYKPFHKNVETTIKTSDRATGERFLGKDPDSGKNVYVRIGKFGPMVQMGESETKKDSKIKPKFVGLKKGQSIETLSLKEALELIKQPFVNNERLLGIDQISGKNVYVRVGKYGPMAQIGETDDKEKPKYTSLKKGQNIDTINLSDVLTLFSLPRNIGVFEYSEMIVAIGRFGPYIKHNSEFYSLGKNDDPYTITEKRAIEVIIEKREKNSKKIIREFKENPAVKVLNGRWGAYIIAEKKNFKIPKGTDVETLTLEDCLKIANIPETTKTVTQRKTKKEKL